jgi:geranylgeranyl diphosphate synthase type 3
MCACDVIEHLHISLNCNKSDILRQRTQDVELKKYCVKLLEELGSLSYTRHTLEELDAEARAEVAKLGGNPLIEYVLDDLMSWKGDTEEKNQEH